jgi:isopropylmalate/homocitrate/citramalate synthase
VISLAASSTVCLHHHRIGERAARLGRQIRWWRSVQAHTTTSTGLYDASQLLTQLTNNRSRRTNHRRPQRLCAGGIHQDGVLKDPSTRSCGRRTWASQRRGWYRTLPGRHAVLQRCDALGRRTPKKSTALTDAVTNIAAIGDTATHRREDVTRGGR